MADGTQTYSALIAQANNPLLESGFIDLCELQGQEVLVEISHCGVCGGDLRLLTRRDRQTRLVPGHEVVGRIVGVGSKISMTRIGERVGIGWQSGSCQNCEWCDQGEPQLCPTQEETCFGRFGGFATHIKVQSHFAVLIPSELNSEDAAPLLCGGLAVYSPLINFRIGRSHRVGVVGIGGLGHMALQFLRAMGAESIAFSHSPAKEADAVNLGATRFVNLGDSRQMQELHSSCHFIICTTSGPMVWPEIVKILKPGGTLCIVGVSQSQIQLSPSELIDERKTLTGNPIGSPTMLRSLFDFVIANEIRPWTETFKMSQANDIIKRLQDGEIRYRAVLTQDLAI